MSNKPFSVFMIAGKYDGCYYVRCLLPLMANGWDGAKQTLKGEKMSSDKMFDYAMKSDIVVFQRPDTKDKTEAIRLLKLAGKKVVFDNDDTYRPDSGYPKLHELDNKKLISDINDELMKNVRQADLITTTTEFLAEEYKEFNDKVVVLPNCVDPFDWDEPIKNDTDKVRIGLVGSVAYGDYQVIEPYLKELAKRDDVQLVMFSLSDVSLPENTKNPFLETYKKIHQESYSFVEENSIEWHRIVPMSQYFEKLNSLKLDIMLIPRIDSYFNRCKSNIKFLEASMLEIPVVASSFADKKGPYDYTIEHEKTGFLAQTEQEWRDYTEKLIKDKSLREKIGKQAKEFTLKNFNINDKAHLWEEAYNKIII